MAPELFRYLYRPSEGDPADALDARYTLAELADRMVVRDTRAGRYLVFDGPGAYWDWAAAVPEAERCFDEVIFGATRQRLKFDIDLAESDVAAASAHADVGVDGAGGAPPDPFDLFFAELDEGEAPMVSLKLSEARRADGAVAAVLDAILAELEDAYAGEGIAPTRRDLAVYDSSGPVGGGAWKYSFHVLVLPYLVADNAEAKHFTDGVRARLPARLRAPVDPAVNKSTQAFRLPGSTKPGAGRTLRAAPRFGTAAEARATVAARAGDGTAGLRLLPPRAPGARGPAPAAAPAPPLVAAALDAAAARGLLEAHAFREARGPHLLFDRLRPSACGICERVHEGDNTLMVLVSADDAGPTAVELCRRAPGRGRFLARLEGDANPADDAPPGAGAGAAGAAAAGAAAAGAAAAGGGRLTEIGRALRWAAAGGGAETYDLEAACASATVYDEAAMRPYEAAATCLVRAQMGVGKTRALRAYLDAHFPAPTPGSPRPPPRVVFVSFRRTFSAALRAAFADFALYSELEGPLSPAAHPRLVVQSESLWRLAVGDEPVDLLVLDESESVLAQFCSGLHRRLAAAFAAFHWLVATARRVVCLDANLGERTCEVVRAYRPGAPPHLHWNRRRRAAGDRYAFTTSPGAWLAALDARLAAGDRLVVPASSLREAEAVAAFVRRRHPALRVGLYSSRTPAALKARHFADVGAHWGALDVLVYTPTVSAGVSFEGARFDALFGYFVDSACDVETCRQMLGRVRALAARAYTVCLAGARRALPATAAAIERELFGRRAALYRDVGGLLGADAAAALALSFEYTPGGEVRRHASPFFALWVQTKRVENLSRNDFVRRFVAQVAATGAAVAELEPPPPLAVAAALAGRRDARAALGAAEAAAVAAAPELDAEEAARVRDALERREPVPPEALFAYRKWGLRDCYAWGGAVDAAFVARYDRPAPRRVFKNLRRAAAAPPGAAPGAAPDVEAALREIQAAERAADADVGGEPAAEAADLGRRKVFALHLAALWLLRLCGFASHLDGAALGRGALLAAARAREAPLRRQLGAVAGLFGLARAATDALDRARTDDEYLAAVLKVTNHAARFMYGVGVVEEPKGGGRFRLRKTKVGRLFAFDPGAGWRLAV